ncbi:B3/4 domain-containing protein [Actinophytocola sp. NPDC049390]|uniref:B3/4 domain-containing protein n=1 Tax=Actinophytocola sp. NPDC049390 TaxID=3363894 RepID=UPI0037B66CC8
MTDAEGNETGHTVTRHEPVRLHGRLAAELRRPRRSRQNPAGWRHRLRPMPAAAGGPWADRQLQPDRERPSARNWQRCNHGFGQRARSRARRPTARPTEHPAAAASTRPTRRNEPASRTATRPRTTRCPSHPRCWPRCTATPSHHRSPRIHPVIDLCNALSLALAIPIGVFDAVRITGGVTVRHANGDEPYLTFGGDTEHPQPDEVIFVDNVGRAHARRWTDRQSGWSAVRDDTTAVLVVAEAVHETAAADIARLTTTITEQLSSCWPTATVTSAALHQHSPRATFSTESPLAAT